MLRKDGNASNAARSFVIASGRLRRVRRASSTSLSSHVQITARAESALNMVQR